MDTQKDTQKDTRVISEELEFELRRAAAAIPTFLYDMSSKAGNLAQDWGANPTSYATGVGVSAKSALRAAKECFETWHLAGVAVKNAANAVEQAAKRVGSSGKEG